MECTAGRWSSQRQCADRVYYREAVKTFIPAYYCILDKR
jgi:hypothetical protein